MAVISDKKSISSENYSESDMISIALKQREDIFLQKIILEFERNQNRKSDDKTDITDVMDKTDHRYSVFVKMVNNLFVDVSTGLLMLKRPNKVQVILPDSLRRSYLYSAHDSLAHCGISRVKDHLQLFYWIGKTKDIQDYVNSCRLCPQKKGNYGKNAPQGGHNVKGESPLDIIYMDYIYMPMSNGFRYCLTIIDSFTRFLRVYPLRKNRAVDTARALVSFVTEFGKIPKRIDT